VEYTRCKRGGVNTMSFILILLDVCLKPSHPSFSYNPSNFFFFLSFLFLFFVLFLFSPILFVHISFLLFHIHMFFLYLPVLHVVVASLSWTVLPRSNKKPPHFTPPSHLPHTASSLLAGTTLTDNQSLCKPFPT